MGLLDIITSARLFSRVTPGARNVMRIRLMHERFVRMQERGYIALHMGRSHEKTDTSERMININVYEHRNGSYHTVQTWVSQDNSRKVTRRYKDYDNNNDLEEALENNNIVLRPGVPISALVNLYSKDGYKEINAFSRHGPY